MEQADARNDPAGSGTTTSDATISDATAPGAPRRWFAPAEWSGAFGDLGTLVPFLLAYIAVVKKSTRRGSC